MQLILRKAEKFEAVEDEWIMGEMNEIMNDPRQFPEHINYEENSIFV